MGSMSSSDAAPLPRLGEVFFDVRGNSRSMRLSWYADTGVAVLSIWQGGMCTGTFRLAIADLPRMIQTLQHGPGAPRPDWDAEARAAEPQSAVARMRAVPLPGEDLLAASEGPRTGAADYLDGRPDDPRSAPAQYQADDPRSASTQYLAPPVDYQADPPDRRPAPPDYLGGAPADRNSAPAAAYMAGSPRERPPSPDYPAGPSGHRAPAPPDYLADPPERRAPAPPDYLADPPGHRADPPGYAPDPHGYPADRPEHPAGPPANYLTGPANYPQDPPGYRPEYPADLPGPSAIGPAGYQDTLRPGGGPGAWNPGADRSAIPRDRRGPADYPRDPYPAGPARRIIGTSRRRRITSPEVPPPATAMLSAEVPPITPRITPAPLPMTTRFVRLRIRFPTALRLAIAARRVGMPRLTRRSTDLRERS